MNEFYEATITPPTTSNNSPEHFDYSVDLESPGVKESQKYCIGNKFVRSTSVSGRFRSCIHQGRRGMFSKGYSISVEEAEEVVGGGGGGDSGCENDDPKENNNSSSGT